MNSELPGNAEPSVESGPIAPPPSSTPPYTAAPLPPGRKKGMRGIGLFLLVLIAFAGGVGATLWTLPTLRQWWIWDDATPTPPQTLTEADSSAKPGADNSVPATSLGVATLEARLAAVSAKLDAISEQANSAGGNAARAEGLLIAFAARRALDRGSQLGYLEGELRLRFADSQPRAVATIINAASAPVTIADLQAGLDEVAPELLGAPGEKVDWWTATRRELSNLIIFRKAGDPSPVPQKVVERARMLIAVGRVGEALHEIEKLPDHDKADNWVQMARKYNEARRALDVIEAAAILEPRSVPASTRPSNQAMQVAPPPPDAPAPNSSATAN